MSLLQKLLTEENVNSRFGFLMVNGTTCISVLSLVGATIWKSNPGNEGVMNMLLLTIGTVLAGGVIPNGASRYLSNRKPATQPQLESTETQTTTVEKTVSAKVKPK